MRDLNMKYLVAALSGLAAYKAIMMFVALPFEFLKVPFAVSVALLVALLVVTMYLGPLGPLFIRQNLERIGLVNRYGESPIPVRLKQSKKVKNGIILELENRNIPREVWEEKRSELEAALNIFIVSIKAGKNRRRVIIEAVPADEGIPDCIPWDDKYLLKDDTSICLGIGLTGLIVKQLDKVPHTLIGGSTGSGKSVLARAFMYQCLRKNMTVCCVDFKGGLDFFKFQQHPYFRLLTTPEELLACLKEYIGELENRKQILLRDDCANLSEYNSKHPEHQHRRVLFAVDELAEVMDKTGRSREEKALIDEITGYLAQLARQGRAVGLHLLLSQQRPDADVLPGQIKSNIDTRICGRSDQTLSTIILGNGDGHELIPKDSQGLFLANGTDTDELALFRGFWFDPATVPRESWKVREV